MAIEGEAPGLSELFRGFKDALESRPAEDKAWSDLEDQIPEAYLRAGDEVSQFGYIHLKNAKFFGTGQNGASLPTDGKGYWRGDLDSVYGWTIGTIAD